MASPLLKKTATIISVKCVCNVKHLEHLEQKILSRASGTKNWKWRYNVLNFTRRIAKGISASELGFLFFL